MIGFWIRPWPEEKLCGEVVAVSGEHLVCRIPCGIEFRVLLEDVRSGRLALYRSRPVSFAA